MKTTPQLRAKYALSQARLHRHHPTCQCGVYLGRWCCEDDYVWSTTVDEELEAIARHVPRQL